MSLCNFASICSFSTHHRHRRNLAPFRNSASIQQELQRGKFLPLLIKNQPLETKTIQRKQSSKNRNIATVAEERPAATNMSSGSGYPNNPYSGPGPKRKAMVVYTPRKNLRIEELSDGDDEPAAESNRPTDVPEEDSIPIGGVRHAPNNGETDHNGGEDGEDGEHPVEAGGTGQDFRGTVMAQVFLGRAHTRPSEQDARHFQHLVQTRNPYQVLGPSAMLYENPNPYHLAMQSDTATTNTSLRGLPSMTAALANPTNNFNTVVRSTGLADALLNVGVTHVAGLQDFMSIDAAGNIENLSRNGNLLFSMIPLSDSDEPSMLNLMGMREFVRDSHGNLMVNPSYWTRQLSHYKGGYSMHVAAYIPRFLLTATDRTEHDQLLEAMHGYNGIGVGGQGEFFKLIFWTKYATVFQKLMEMPVVQEARKLGMWPLFLMRQCINQQISKKMRHPHLATTDMSGHSSIMLAGFHRDDTPLGEPEFSKLIFVSVLGRDGALLTQRAPRKSNKIVT